MIKRVAFLALVGAGAAILAGCPIYPADDNGSCWGEDCGGYRGDAGPKTPTSTCAKPSDCEDGQNCGSDNLCHDADCTTTGCPTAHVCLLRSGVATCVPTGGSGPVDGGGAASACQNDEDCPTPAGSRCLSGACVAPQDLCADTTQCPAGARCVDGACTQACGGTITKPCPTGYTCDAQNGVCTGNANPCGTGSNACTGGNVCVQEHCVAPCGAGGTCPGGQVCVDGGCTPDEKPVFTCATEGVQDACQPGSICLRHSCYIACDADASASCQSADQFNQCKTVSTGSGSYAVCGSSSNLGTECDPTQNKACASAALICIDGFCR